MVIEVSTQTFLHPKATATGLGAALRLAHSAEWLMRTMKTSSFINDVTAHAHCPKLSLESLGEQSLLTLNLLMQII